MNSVDPSGRISDRSLLTTLGWTTGDRLAVTADGTRMIIFHREDGAPHALIHNARISIPASLRRRCGIRARDRVLLAANRELDLVVVYTQSALEEALSTLHQADAEADR